MNSKMNFQICYMSSSFQTLDNALGDNLKKEMNFPSSFEIDFWDCPKFDLIAAQNFAIEKREKSDQEKSKTFKPNSGVQDWNTWANVKHEARYYWKADC